MEITIRQMKKHCQDQGDCEDGCLMYTTTKDECVFEDSPENWDIEEIEKRLNP